MSDIEDEDYKNRIKELIDRVEIGENSPEAYQQLLEKIKQVKRSAISKTEKQSRNEKVIVALVYILRECYWLISDPKHPFEKENLLKEIDALYKLIYGELKKPNPNIPDTWDLDEKRRILNDIKVVLGTENMEYFFKKYNLRKVVRLKFDMREGYKYYVYVWIIAFIILITILLLIIL